MLVIVHDRDLHALAQGLLDDEAFRRLDVLEVDAAEAGLHQRHGIDEGFGVLGIELDVDGVDIGEALEQDRLAFHHRLGGQRAEIAHPQDRRAIGDDGDEIALSGIIIGGRRIFGNHAHRDGDAGRISQRQVALRRHRLGRNDLDLAGAAGRMEKQRFTLGKFDIRVVGHGSGGPL